MSHTSTRLTAPPTRDIMTIPEHDVADDEHFRCMSRRSATPATIPLPEWEGERPGSLLCCSVRMLVLLANVPDSTAL